MIKEKDNSFLREVTLERNSLLAEVKRLQLKKLKSDNIILQRELSKNNEATHQYIRDKIKELSEKKELSVNDSSTIPIFFSQPQYSEETEYTELSNLDSLLQKATEAVIRRK